MGPHMGLFSDRSSCVLGMYLAAYVPQLILQAISGTVWVYVVGHAGPVR